MTFELRLRNGTHHTKILGGRIFQTEETADTTHLTTRTSHETGTKGVREKVREDATGGSGRGQITKHFRFSPSVLRSH